MSKTFHKIKLFALREWSRPNFIHLLIYGSYKNHLQTMHIVVQMYTVTK